MDTHVVEKLAEIVANSKLKTEYLNVESEHSALSACIGAQATGVRTFTASSSQGIALMHEMLFIASGLRMPIVMAVANRALSAPINIWCDHSDTMAERDSGWLQFYCESSQEAYDTIIQAYKISENKNVLLPSMVCVDGFTLSHVSEPVDLLSQQQVNSFLPNYKPEFKLDTKKPLTLGPIVYPQHYMFFKQKQQEAMEKAKQEIKNINKQFRKKFGRAYGDGLIETYKMQDASHALIGIGSLCSTARAVIDAERKKGKKIGLIRIRTFRPFPAEELIRMCRGLKGIAVIERAFSYGNAGPLFTEIKALLREKIKINNFIAGIGGRDVTPEIISKAINKIGQKQEIEWLF